MNKETIKKAARELCTSPVMDPFLKDYGMACFTEGTRWRINSVWHDASEVPERSGMCILIRQNGDPLFVKFYVQNDWKEFVECNKIERWSYLSDLLPIPQNSGELKRKEVQP